GPDGDEVELNVEGDDRPITKSAPGGWSQRRFQQRAEDSWEHNAAGVAERIQRLAAEKFPDLVVIGGDERAVELISGRLPDDLRSVTRTIAPGRAADGSEDQRDEQIDRLMNTAVAEETVGLLREFEEQEGREARGANGADATLEALQRSRVDVLLVHDDADDKRPAWFSAEPGMVAMRGDDLEELGVSKIVTARVVDVAINAALRTGAAIRVVPDAAAIEGGIAAILRWP
ncbi:MAG: Vms1/Ankzf1 family peptidyl-tRNA hydrolase, partial [Ilumatobacteraceae bacterium]